MVIKSPGAPPQLAGATTTNTAKHGGVYHSIAPPGKKIKEGNKMLIKELRNAIESEKVRSAWDKGVKEYALELIEEMDDNLEFYGSPADKKELLNGADDWLQYSYGGCSLIYDGDIAERLCSPSELKKTRNGERRPNAREEWLDVQARALYQASNKIMRLAKLGTV